MSDIVERYPPSTVRELEAEIERLRRSIEIYLAEIRKERAEKAELLAAANAARIVIKNRDQRPNEVKVYHALCAAIARAEGK